MSKKRHSKRSQGKTRSGRKTKTKRKPVRKRRLSVGPRGEPEKYLLNVGGDDSNHSGDARGDIIVATFSLYSGDGTVYNFTNTRDYAAAGEWCGFPGRGYLFTLLTGERYRASQQNVVSQMPKLIRTQLSKEEISPRKIRVSLDGRLNSDSRNALRSNLLDIPGVEEAVANNFIKSRGYPRCPSVVYVADVIANQLFGLTVEELLTHPNFIA